MTVPHPMAAGSLGPKFIRWAEAREGRPLRWWQRLVATRLLEVDGQGELVWQTMVLSMARQLGKSWLLRELCLWRIHQAGHFGEPQDIVHTGKDLSVCQEIQLPARWWAKERPELYKVREVNGQESIQYLPDKSRWMLRAKEAAYGHSVSVVAVDEAWKVKPATVAESMTPTMVERVQPQLWLISTAHRQATSLMRSRRHLALEQLEAGDGDLLIEWSAPAEAPLERLETWRMASPHWTPQREREVAKALAVAQAGETPDPDEPDPEQSFRAQWLNQWPKGMNQPGAGEPLLPAGLWGYLADPGMASTGPLFVAVEDKFGEGAAVAVAALLDDGRIEVDGWLYDDWDSAMDRVNRLGAWRRIRHLQVGASMLKSVPQGMTPRAQAAGTAETRIGLPLLRDLAAAGMIAHHDTGELDHAVTAAQVKQLSAGLALMSHDETHLVKACVWAVQAAHKQPPSPAVA
jgi:hypothetical protein